MEFHFRVLLHPCNYNTVPSNFSLLLHKDFPHATPPSKSSTRQCSRTAKPSNPNEHCTIQKGSFQCTVAAVDNLVVCYLPYLIIIAYIWSSKNLSSSVYLALEVAVTLVFLNSSLNPILYSWKIREVRQAVKHTIRQLFQLSSR